ncbi:biosynthetic-type acetolactate synthase large subunit [Nevskia sp.]|uniref:biosynthetic-type acetolactate synthase large subunit n=1 Tax=Nevskia sp. TaxID=1929292 RepID=UPI0025EB1886|nr:biosynthetic-type acetolactate synthase large subunit [Nevskia sp.]
MNAPLQHDTHPLAGQTMSGADIIVQVLADEGVDVVFGYSGGAILPTYDAIFRFNAANPSAAGEDPMPLIVPANEQGAGFMAAGYARSSGRVGVALVTSGPGATNTVTPVRDSMADSTPIVVICGQVPTSAMGTDAFQEAPISNIMAACAKHVFLVTDPSKLEATVRTAFEIARTGRPGPVVVDVPKDVQNWKGVFTGRRDVLGRLPVPGYRARLRVSDEARIDEASLAHFHELLKAAKRPMIYAGGGVIHAEAAEQLRAFANEYGIPTVMTLMGLGAYDTTDPLSMHMLGMHGTAYANYAIDDCDLLIAIGARFDDRVAGVPSKFARNAKAILHFDVDASEINKVKRVTWSHVGNLKVALTQVLAHGRAQNFKPDYSEWHGHVAELKRVHAMNYDRASVTIQPYAIIEAINRITKGDAIIATGVGQHQMWAAQYFDFRQPRLWLTSGSMGTMGFGLPAAIGAQFANPKKIVVDIDGDASVRMNIGEMETITNYGLPIKVVVLNNSGDGMVRQWQKLFHESRFSGSDKTLHKKDFVKAAQADGFEYAVQLSNPADIDRVVGEFVAFPGPAFLEVVIDRDAGVYPMVGPGMSYAEMITGDWIASREPPKVLDVSKTQLF